MIYYLYVHWNETKQSSPSLQSRKGKKKSTDSFTLQFLKLQKSNILVQYSEFIVSLSIPHVSFLGIE